VLVGASGAKSAGPAVERNELVCALAVAEIGLDWPRHGPTWVMILGQLLPIAAALGFVLAWIVILSRIRT